ncbi:hypothetical protein [Streptomyces albireticuli]|uniref:Glycosyl transferase family 2 n=1 Tax=Streptomyces albireticuli TaxID=1940 RepID=A0A2A2CYQ6_9ACTN|nr:hypothetical protein [Streptomyces albireticuli]MCD9145876.1 hypothetical protein [Streptomyces albireticuli]MCD9166137.1 hypothetical protein [Streptomyces albireticuli]MCD9189639.1 hypothetical protein [Streptomyces albireticuli]PAU45348.1 hypothetical protein CK936_29910 [Streptomyces albireticuli]
MTSAFDAVLLSYDEPMANALHRRLGRVLGGTVKRLHGVRGMRRAYRLCAELADTEQFFLADGDFSIDTRFPAAGVEPLADGISMRVWRAVNPVNGLTYGYGGLKLIRRDALRKTGEAVDVLAALPGKVEFCEDTAGTTRFNQSSYHAWKAGFRECAMLTRGSEYGMADADVQDRLDAWTASREGDFASYAAAGARDGIAFARDAARDPAQFDLLNDPAWLRERFTAGHGEQAVAG